eukprot:gene22202-30442_t
MIVAIEKELMAVGFSALLFKIACNSANFLTPEWLISLEISDILVPGYVFFSCLQCMVIVLTAMKQCFMWSRAYHLHVEEVLDEFYKLNIPRYLEWTLSFHEAVKLLEFRIYNIIFCEMHHISRAAPFNEYVSVCFEKYILSFIETYPSDWLILVLMVLLCQSLSTWTGHGEWYGDHCEPDDPDCITLKEVQVFTIFGTMIFFATVLLTLVTRHYQKAIMKRRGLDGISDYTEFLKQMDDEEVRLSKKNVLNDEQLKATLVYAKEKKIIDDQNFHSTSYYIRVYPRVLYHRLLEFAFGSRKEEDDEKDDSNGSNTETDSGRHQPMSAASLNLSINTKPTVSFSDSSIKSNNSSVSSRIRSTFASKKLHIISEDSIMEEVNNSMRSPAAADAAMSKDRVMAFDPSNNTQLQDKMEDIENNTRVSMLEDSSSMMEDLEENDNENEGSTAASKGDAVTLRSVSMGKKDADDVVNAIEGMMSKLNAPIEHSEWGVGWNKGTTSSRRESHSHRSTRTYSSRSPVRSRLPSVSSAIHPAPLVSSNSASRRAVLTTVKSFVLMRPDINPEISVDILNKSMHIHKEKDFIIRLFLFEKPEWYFASLKVMLMIISAYFAFWIVEFVAASPGIWKLISVLPGLVSGFLFLHVMKSAAILKAVYVLDNEAMLEVLEQCEGSDKLGEEVREKLLSRLQVDNGDPFLNLKRLFNEIDDDGSHRLSRIEFEDLMRELGVHFSRKKWDHVDWRSIDWQLFADASQREVRS